MKRKFFTALFTAAALLMITGQSVAAEETDTVSENQIYEITEESPELSEQQEELTEEAKTSKDKESGAVGFLKRLYDVCLDRVPDDDGIAYWMKLLESGKETGIHTAYDFVFSPEFQNKNLCNEDYVKYLYKAFMGREYDRAGLEYWLGFLNTGTMREEVFNEFATSEEFRLLCKEYGIPVGKAVELPEYGTVPHGNCSVCGKVDGVTAFVTRLYNICLDRKPDQDGLDYWRYLLWIHAKTGADISSYFVFSEEFEAKDLDDIEFTEYMYRAFFDREADIEEVYYWMEQMYIYGMNRSHVFAGFVNSKEFNALCQQYGITRGVYTPVFDKLTPDSVAKMSYREIRALKMDIYSNQDTLTKEQADSLMTTITVPVWDFLNSNSMTKVSKQVKLTCHKNFAEYFQMAFEDLYNDPSQPVIHPGSCYSYKYRANVNNTSVLSNHSYGTAIDINPGENPNGKAMVTKAAWDEMPEGSVAQKQKKAYTIYEGSPYYRIFHEKYHMNWLGYNRTVDAMHFDL